MISFAGARWLKGNLHTHSTLSDGVLEPEDVFRLYADAGYDFFSLTDHWFMSEGGQFGQMTLLPGIELDCGREPVGGIFHIVGIGMTRQLEITRADSLKAQDLIDAINAVGGLAILAHPAWSLETPEQILPLRGLAAVEIFNTFSGIPWNSRPDSSLIIDMLAARGYLLPLIAADDSHFYTCDPLQNFIYVQAEQNTQAAILKALREGSYFASQGPMVSCSKSGNRLHVHCTPVSTIVFNTAAVYSARRVVSGTNLTEAEYKISAADRFVRVEVIDAAGKRAWTSPV